MRFIRLTYRSLKNIYRSPYFFIKNNEKRYIHKIKRLNLYKLPVALAKMIPFTKFKNMKIPPALLLLLLAGLVSCSKNEVRHSEINVVNVSSLSFFKVASDNSIPLSASENNISFAFGEPVTTKEGIAELNKFPCTKWIYKGATMYIQGGRLVDIDLKTSDYGLVVDGKLIKVGDDMSELKTIFPNSFGVKSSRRLFIGLHYNGEPVKSLILFDYNREGKITTISLMD